MERVNRQKWLTSCWVNQEQYELAMYHTCDVCAKFHEFLSMSSPSKMHSKCEIKTRIIKTAIPSISIFPAVAA